MWPKLLTDRCSPLSDFRPASRARSSSPPTERISAPGLEGRPSLSPIALRNLSSAGSPRMPMGPAHQASCLGWQLIPALSACDLSLNSERYGNLDRLRAGIQPGKPNLQWHRNGHQHNRELLTCVYAFLLLPR